MQELADKVWSNEAYHAAADEIERGWLARSLALPSVEMDADRGRRALQAAIILAASSRLEHRHSAFRIATYASRLFPGLDGIFSAALRVVLSRLGNFPSISTDSLVESSLQSLPWAIAMDEIDSRQRQTVVSRNKAVTLTNFQHKIWTELIAGRNLAVSAPTSAGKSFVLQNYIAGRFEGPDDLVVVYLVPTRALIAQVSEELERYLRGVIPRVEIITVPLDADAEVPARAAMILTPERLQVILNSHPALVVDLLVVDEAHTIEDGSRGILLQWVIDDVLSRADQTQIMFASPIVRNLDVFARLFDKKVIESKSSDPTVGQNFIVVEIQSANKGRVAIRRASHLGESDDPMAVITIGHTLATKIEKLVHISARFSGDAPSIVYANGAAEAEVIALQLAQFSDDDVSDEMRSQRETLAKLAKEVVHEKFVLAECIKSGVAFHYSVIPAALRQAVEKAFDEGTLSHIVCTSTLLQGVNTPAKNIFLCSPEKGRRNPLESTDFWNLSGRAGRLMKEFQGNIFLIDYALWRSHPLLGPKDNVVVPALERILTQKSVQMFAAASDSAAPLAPSDLDDVSSAITRLYVDAKEGGRAEATLARLQTPLAPERLGDLVRVLREETSRVSLPVEILKQAPSLSVYRQQDLADSMMELISEGGPSAAEKLLPLHPREANSFQSYAEILEMCHRILMRRDTSRNLHRFHALMARKWMLGIPLPQIIEEQIKRNPATDTRTTIRKTLETIETVVRFEVVRLITSYNAILSHTLSVTGHGELREGIAALPIYLEVGASDRTMISFMALGLSRAAAMKLNVLSNNKNMDVTTARSWLTNTPIESLGLSPLLADEVQRIKEI